MSFSTRRYAAMFLGALVAFLVVHNNTNAQIITSTVIVQVQDRDTDQVIAGASVSLTGYGSKTTDSSGIAIFPSVAQSSYTLTTSATGFSGDSHGIVVNDLIEEDTVLLVPSFTLNTGPQQIFKNSSGSTIAVFDEDGNLQVSGSIMPGASTGQLAETPGVSEVLFKHGNTVVARLDSSGNLYLMGTFLRYLSTIDVGARVAYKIKNSSGTVVAAIDEVGDLQILGGSNGF